MELPNNRDQGAAGMAEELEIASGPSTIKPFGPKRRELASKLYDRVKVFNTLDRVHRYPYSTKKFDEVWKKALVNPESHPDWVGIEPVHHVWGNISDKEEEDTFGFEEALTASNADEFGTEVDPFTIPLTKTKNPDLLTSIADERRLPDPLLTIDYSLLGIGLVHVSVDNGQQSSTSQQVLQRSNSNSNRPVEETVDMQPTDGRNQSPFVFKLSPSFEPCQHVNENKCAKPFTAIKVNKSVKLLLAQSELDEQWIFTGLCHSHPKYSKFPIVNGKSEYKTPFEVNMPNLIEHITVKVERTDVTIHGVLVLLKNENHINLGYTVISTCPTNHGNKKEGKEWFQLVVPVSSKRTQDLIRNPILTIDDMTSHSKFRVQVREENRNYKLAKDRSSNEITFPVGLQVLERNPTNEKVVKKMAAKLRRLPPEKLLEEAKRMGVEVDGS